MGMDATRAQKAGVLTVAQAYLADQKTAELGISTFSLMEAAGRAVAQEALMLLADRKGPVVVLCGPGNNGGDGFIAAGILRGMGTVVRLALLGDPAALRGDALRAAEQWHASNEPIFPLSLDVLAGASLVIDALFGAGLNRPLDGVALACIQAVNERSIPCLAVDVPSGVAGDSGALLGDAPFCAATVTFGCPKPAHYLYPAKERCGTLRVADIGIPPNVISEISPRLFLNGNAAWALPSWSWQHHKYSRGHALVFGSAAMSGAARLAVKAARRAGAGLVTVAAPAAALPVYGGDAPGALLAAWDCAEDAERLLGDGRMRAVLIGPGLPASSETRRLVLDALASPKDAILLDAGALSAFEGQADGLFRAIAQAKGQVVLTPHDGEYKRLFGARAGSRLERACYAAGLSRATVLLKGADTVIAGPDGTAVLTARAPIELATAGSGDVLAGVILGLLVQGMPGLWAAAAGAWLHAEAAFLFGPGLIAEDIVEFLPKVLRRLSLVTTLEV